MSKTINTWVNQLYQEYKDVPENLYKKLELGHKLDKLFPDYRNKNNPRYHIDLQLKHDTIVYIVEKMKLDKK